MGAKQAEEGRGTSQRHSARRWAGARPERKQGWRVSTQQRTAGQDQITVKTIQRTKEAKTRGDDRGGRPALPPRHEGLWGMRPCGLPARHRARGLCSPRCPTPLVGGLSRTRGQGSKGQAAEPRRRKSSPPGRRWWGPRAALPRVG